MFKKDISFDFYGTFSIETKLVREAVFSSSCFIVT